MNLTKQIIRKNLGKSMIYYNTPCLQLEEQTDKAFQELSKYTKPETRFETPR